MPEESSSSFMVYRYRVKPLREEQLGLAFQALGNCRWVYNQAVATDKLSEQSGEKRPTYNQLAKSLVEWKQQHAWLSLSPSQTLQQALMDFCSARKAHWQDRENFAAPKFKSRDDFSQSLRFPQPKQSDWNADKGWVVLPKFGQISYFKDKRKPKGELKQVFLVREGDRWYVCLCCNVSAEKGAKLHNLPANPFELPQEQVVGVDLGHVNALTTSEGKHYHLPLAKIAQLDAKIAVVQAIIEHKKNAAKALFKHLQAKALVVASEKPRDSKSLLRAKRKLRRLQAKRKDILTNARHQLSHLLTEEYAVLVAEDLKLKKLMENEKQKENSTSKVKSLPEKFSRENFRKIHSREMEKTLHKGWAVLGAGILLDQIQYKAKNKGGVLLKVNPAYTSQTCPKCLCVSSQNRKSQAVFCCIDCGYTANADIVASLNVLRLGWESLMSLGYPVPAAPKYKRPRSPRRSQKLQAV